MHITHLSLTDFRNFSRLDVDVPDGATLLLGDNAQGKTSLLEAIYYLAAFTSFHANSDRELINFIAGKSHLAVGRIVADYLRGGKSHRLEVRLIQEKNGANGAIRMRKEILLDGAKRRTSEVIGHFNAVLFLPQMLQVIEGSPSGRRRYLDLLLSQTIPNYAAALSTYNKAISQRNALLKLLSERGGDPDQLAFWDDKITLSGTILIEARIHAIHEIGTLAALTHSELTRGVEVLRLAYHPAYEPFPQQPGQIALPLDAPLDRTGISKTEIVEGFQAALTEKRTEEIARGLTTIGPHRDELRFLANGIDLGTYGSRGQARTAMLAVKMAEVTWMKEKTGHWPVLLLDEVLAELDPQRRADLLARLAQAEQALLTTTDLDLFTEAFVQNAQQWHIQGGRLQATVEPSSA
jgi:DNA replication and repair protein RecF